MKKQTGISLLEGLIALAIFSVGILGLAAFQLKAMKNSEQAGYRTIASYLSEEMIGYMMTDTNNPTQFAVVNGACTTPSNARCASWISKVNKELPGVANLSSPTVTYYDADNAAQGRIAGDVEIVIKWKKANEGDENIFSSVSNIKPVSALPTPIPNP